MKLYYAPGACSLSPHIVANEAGIPLDLVKVDMKTKTVAREGDFWDVNPKGYVPALELDDGEVLTEGPAIVQYLADLVPAAAALAPPNGSFERVRLQETLNYLTSEIHKSYSPLFKPDVLPAVREERLAYLTKRYALHREAARGPQVPVRRPLHGRRCLPLHADALGPRREARPVGVPESRGVPEARRQPQGGARGDAGRGADPGQQGRVN